MRWSKQALFLLALTSTLAASEASAQPAVSLTGTYRCIQGCAPGFESRPAFVTQNGWDMNIVTEDGYAVRAWFDWFAPTTRIWIERWQQGAVYSADGMTIQFDNGRLWQRDLGPPLPPPQPRRSRN